MVINNINQQFNLTEIDRYLWKHEGNYANNFGNMKLAWSGAHTTDRNTPRGQEDRSVPIPRYWKLSLEIFWVTLSTFEILLAKFQEHIRSFIPINTEFIVHFRDLLRCCFTCTSL